MTSRLSKRCLIGWLVGVLVADVLLCLLYIGLSYAAVHDDDRAAAIAILWGDDIELGRETERRIAHAVAIWQSGEPSRLIFCIGGARPARSFFGAQQVTETLVSRGVPRDRIRSGAGSRDTVSNVAEIAQVASAVDIRKVTVVSSRLQAMRASVLPQPERLDIVWSPYGLTDARPAMTAVELWSSVHREWLAVVSMVVPSGFRTAFLERWRR